MRVPAGSRHARLKNIRRHRRSRGMRIIPGSEAPTLFAPDPLLCPRGSCPEAPGERAAGRSRLNRRRLRRGWRTCNLHSVPRNNKGTRCLDLAMEGDLPMHGRHGSVDFEPGAALRCLLQEGSEPGTARAVARLHTRVPIIRPTTTIREFGPTLSSAPGSVKKCLTSNEIGTILARALPPVHRGAASDGTSPGHIAARLGCPSRHAPVF